MVLGVCGGSVGRKVFEWFVEREREFMELASGEFARTRGAVRFKIANMSLICILVLLVADNLKGLDRFPKEDGNNAQCHLLDMRNLFMR